MKTDKIVKLQINDELYNYQAFPLKVFTYIVRGVRDYGDSILYEIVQVQRPCVGCFSNG